MAEDLGGHVPPAEVLACRVLEGLPGQPETDSRDRSLARAVRRQPRALAADRVITRCITAVNVSASR